MNTKNCVKAVPHYNDTNKYLLYKLLKLLNLKTAKDFLELIKEILQNDTVYIFEKNTNVIKHSMFKNNKHLTEVIIPDIVKIIGVNAFSYCFNLTEVIIPDSVIYIYNYAFYRCVKLENVVMSTNVKKIEKFAFSLCRKLKTLTLPKNIIAGRDSFYHETEIKINRN